MRPRRNSTKSTSKTDSTARTPVSQLLRQALSSQVYRDVSGSARRLQQAATKPTRTEAPNSSPRSLPCAHGSTQGQIKKFFSLSVRQLSLRSKRSCLLLPCNLPRLGTHLRQRREVRLLAAGPLRFRPCRMHRQLDRCAEFLVRTGWESAAPSAK